MDDWMNQNFYDGRPPKMPDVPKGPSRKHKVPERDKLFRVQKNLYKAIHEVRSMLADNEMQNNPTLDRYLNVAYRNIRQYLDDHTEAV